MNQIQAEQALLLPVESLPLLGAGVQGVAALRAYSIATPPDFAASLAEMTRSLEEADDPEAPFKLAASTLLTGLAGEARAWLSLTSPQNDLAPALVLVAPDAALVAILHGAVVEYLIGDTTIVRSLVEAARRAAEGGEIELTAFMGDDSVAGIRFHEDRVDLAASSSSVLEALGEAAREDNAHLLAALIDEVTQ